VGRIINTDVTFSLRNFIREIAEKLESTNQHRIAQEVLAQIPPDSYDAAVTEAMASYVGTVIKVSHPQLHPVPDNIPASPPRPRGHSPRSDMIRSAFAELRARYACLDPGKEIGNYTADDLIFVARYLESQAGQLQQKASNFRRLAETMSAFHAATVADLPEEVLKAAFRGES
jgi:hypothetical protein